MQNTEWKNVSLRTPHSSGPAPCPSPTIARGQPEPLFLAARLRGHDGKTPHLVIPANAGIQESESAQVFG
jgi:hypothetical protein